jgi:hypothetical protein
LPDKQTQSGRAGVSTTHHLLKNHHTVFFKVLFVTFCLRPDPGKKIFLDFVIRTLVCW